MNMQSICYNNEFSINDIKNIFEERPDILQLILVVKDDPGLIKKAIALIEIHNEKEYVTLDRLEFIPVEHRDLFERKAAHGILSFDNYLVAATEMINL